MPESKLVEKKILFDIVEMKVGCPILQALYGGSPRLSNGFDAETWFIGPTPNMKLYSVTDEELEQLSKKLAADPERKDA